MMLIVGDDDDSFHQWDAADPAWIETFWYGAWLPDIRTTVYIYQWFRPVLGIYGGGCFVWDASAHLPWDIPFFRYEVNRPISGPLDLRELTLDCGTSLRALEDGKSYAVGFRSDAVEVDLRFDATTGAERVSATDMGAFYRGHIDQSGRYTGRLMLDGREHAIDCYGIRDRSWGPRVITDDIRLSYCHGQSADMAFVVYTRPSGDQDIPFKGSLSFGGESALIVGGHRRPRYLNGKLEAIEIELIDEAGRRIAGVGRPLNTFVYEPYPGLVNWLHLMEWRIGAHVIYGEEQDVWSLPLWHARDRRGRS